MRECGPEGRRTRRESTEKFVKNALAMLAQDELPILKISDFNTTGLTVGAKGDDRNSDWAKLTKSVGASDKHAGKLGSFGIGKHATYACSDLRTVFYGTLDTAAMTAVQGAAKLVTHLKERNVTTQGTGYFGVKNGYKPILEFDSLPPFFERKKVGADVYIMGFHDFPEWEARIIKSVIESFFLAIHTGKLIVKVGKTTVKDTSLPKLIGPMGARCGGGVGGLPLDRPGLCPLRPASPSPRQRVLRARCGSSHRILGESGERSRSAGRATARHAPDARAVSANFTVVDGPAVLAIAGPGVPLADAGTDRATEIVSLNGREPSLFEVIPQVERARNTSTCGRFPRKAWRCAYESAAVASCGSGSLSARTTSRRFFLTRSGPFPAAS
jgi:hypothetical protein